MKKVNRSGFSLKDKYYYLSKSNCLCARCGTQLYLDTMTVEHVIPVGKGGTNKKDNMVALCWSCNNSKGGSLILPSTYYRYLLHNEAMYLDGDYRVHKIKLLVESGKFLNKQLIQFSRKRFSFICDVLQYFCYKQKVSVNLPEDKIKEILKKGGFYGVYSNNVFCGLLIHLATQDKDFSVIYVIPYISSIDFLIIEGLHCFIKSLSDKSRIALCVLKGSQVINMLSKSVSIKATAPFSRRVFTSKEELLLLLSKYDNHEFEFRLRYNDKVKSKEICNKKKEVVE